MKRPMTESEKTIDILLQEEMVSRSFGRPNDKYRGIMKE